MKLIAHKNVKDPMPIHPASNKRQWMDETIHQYAYRCLPLQIANASGYELLSPCDIIVVWNGSNHKDGLSIHYEKSGNIFAASSFGHGILTLHPGYLFKTIKETEDEPLYDLYVTGLPNYFYEFMTPLTGIVETFWLPFTFTMNWKILKPGTFKILKDEPLAFLMPIPHEFPKINPIMTELSKHKEVEEEYKKWSKTRSETIKALEMVEKTGQPFGDMDPSKPSTMWEKNYFQGIDKEGKKNEEHLTKRRLPDFKNSY